MPRDYYIERDAIIKRWYGANSQPNNPRPQRTWNQSPITPADCLGIPVPVNSPFTYPGHCMVWKYGLNRDGYGTLNIDGKQELAHRVAFIETKGQVPAGNQVNHLCNRPYCVQPSHLYAGTRQDNKDDSRIFSDPELINAPWILGWPEGTSASEPLPRRLLESARYDYAQPWEPLIQPGQRPLEEFTCPAHDFAITMQGGHSRICRICETSEFQEEMMDESGTYFLIAEICPVSQTVLPIFRKIVASEFVAASQREARRRAYNRSSHGFGMGSHYLRNCGCAYCIQDRKAFRAVIQPLLTGEESQIIDICDTLESHITKGLEQASVEMMGALAKASGMNDEQTQTLRDHFRDCTNTRADLTRVSRMLEGELGYLLYAMVIFNDREAFLEDQMFQQIVFRWRLTRMRKEDEEHILRTILPVVEEAADRMALAWESEADELTRPYLESKPELYRGIKYLAQALIKKQFLEHLRYELLGRNNAGEQQPHPHSYCVASTIEEGRVQPFPTEFEEGMGYMPREV